MSARAPFSQSKRLSSPLSQAALCCSPPLPSGLPAPPTPWSRAPRPSLAAQGPESHLLVRCCWWLWPRGAPSSLRFWFLGVGGEFVVWVWLPCGFGGIGAWALGLVAGVCGCVDVVERGLVCVCVTAARPGRAVGVKKGQPRSSPPPLPCPPHLENAVTHAHHTHSINQSQHTNTRTAVTGTSSQSLNQPKAPPALARVPKKSPFVVFLPPQRARERETSAKPRGTLRYGRGGGGPSAAAAIVVGGGCPDQRRRRWRGGGRKRRWRRPVERWRRRRPCAVADAPAERRGHRHDYPARPARARRRDGRGGAAPGPAPQEEGQLVWERRATAPPSGESARSQTGPPRALPADTPFPSFTQQQQHRACAGPPTSRRSTSSPASESPRVSGVGAVGCGGGGGANRGGVAALSVSLVSLSHAQTPDPALARSIPTPKHQQSAASSTSAAPSATGATARTAAATSAGPTARGAAAGAVAAAVAPGRAAAALGAAPEEKEQEVVAGSPCRPVEITCARAETLARAHCGRC